MSLLQSKRKSIKTRGIFAAILGVRLSGKSTVAGTLPGKSAMMTAKTFETGSASAEQLAKNLGAELDVYEFTSSKDLIAMCKEAALTYNNIFIDGASGLTEILYRQPDVAKAVQKNAWNGYALLGDYVEDALLAIKDLTEVDGGVNIFVTASVDPKYDQAGNILEYVIESKGKSIIKNIRKIFPVVVSLRAAFNENGHRLDEPEMITKTEGVYSGRIDSLLAQDNPGILPADLTTLISLIKGA